MVSSERRSLLAFELLAGERQIGVGGGEVGLGLLKVDLEGLAVDLGEGGAGGDAVSDLGEHSVDLAGDFGRDGDGVEGADLADQLDAGIFGPHLGQNELHLAGRERPFDDLLGGSPVIGFAAVASDERADRQ